MKDDGPGTLSPKELHPATESAYNFLQTVSPADLASWLEAFSSCAIEGNRLGEVCADTLRRLIDGKPVSDRYVLGLAWTVLKGTKPVVEE